MEERDRACGCSVAWDEECNGGKYQSGNPQRFFRDGWAGLDRWDEMSCLPGDFWGSCSSRKDLRVAAPQQPVSSVNWMDLDWAGLRDRRGSDVGQMSRSIYPQLRLHLTNPGS